MQYLGVFRPLGGFYIPIIFVTNSNSLLEIINRSGFELLIDMPTGGSVVQEARSKAIYRMQGIQGQQVVTIQAQQAHDINYGWNATFSPSYDKFFVNIWQEGETEWYPPTSITEPEIHGGVSNATASVNGGTSGTILTIPAASPTPPLTNGYLQLTKFQVSVTASAAFENHEFQLTGAGTTLEYTVASKVNDTFWQQEVWDPPLTSDANTALVFKLVVPFTSAILRLNAFWYEVFS